MRLFLLSLFLIISQLSCIQYEQEDSLTIGINSQIENFDPALPSSVEHTIIKNQIFETLLSLDEKNQIKGNLVNRWAISKDLKHYNFCLKPNIRFHDGIQLTSGLIKLCIENYIEKNHSLFTKLYKSITIIDSLNFSINLQRPSSSLIYSLTSPFYILIGKKLTTAKESNFINFVGTGPYYFKSKRDVNTIQIKKYEQYRESKDSNIKSINVRYNLKIEGSETILDRSKIDILYLISGYQIDRLKWEGKFDYFVQTPKSTIFIGFNYESDLFKSKINRKILSNVLEVDRLIFNINRGNAIRAHIPLPPVYDISLGMESISNNQDLEKLNINQNDSLYTNVNFFFPKIAFSRRTILEYLKSTYSKLGIRLNVTEYDSWAAHDAAIKSDSAELFIDAYYAEVLGDPANFLYSLFHSQSDKNTLHYHNKIVDKLIDRAIIENNVDRRRKIYKEILQLISEDTPAIFLSHVKPHFAYRIAKIKKLVVNKYGIIQFHQSTLN